MTRVMMWCWDKGKEVFTGVDLPSGSQFSGLATQEIVCPECHQKHLLRNLYFEGLGPTRAHKYWVALELVPARPFAAEVGILISAIAMVEYQIPALLSRLTGLRQEDAEVIAGSFTYSGRGDLLEHLLKNTKATGDPVTAVKRFLPRIRSAGSIRNKYSHARYGWSAGPGQEPQITIWPFASDIKKNPQPENKKLDDLVRDVQTINELICDLENYVHNRVLPPEL